MFLTYTFVSTPVVSRGRSTPYFPPRQLSPTGRIVARHPFPVPLPTLPTAYLPLTPLRGFSSPRDQSAGPIRRREAYPGDSPDCLSLPASCMIEPAACGSTFQTRYVSPDLLFREPLGTIVIMRSNPFCVNRKEIGNGAFQQKLSVFVSALCSAPPVHELWIKQGRGELFRFHWPTTRRRIIPVSVAAQMVLSRVLDRNARRAVAR